MTTSISSEAQKNHGIENLQEQGNHETLKE